MKNNQWIWAIALVVLLCVIVPYGVLGEVHAWYGSFLFWALAGLVVIVVNIVMTRDFKEHDRD